jgi:SAM-dependent methyltransferase
MIAKSRTATNRKTWNKVCDKFVDASALPVWGPFSIGKGIKLLPTIKGKKFLEICCGSGRSIAYLVKHGAKKVYGLDISENQIAEATKHNGKAIEKGIVRLFHAPMEKRIKIEPVDAVFSIYGLGWTQDQKRTLANIYSYLKQGGVFVWSWEHSIFSDVSFENNKFIVKYPYHEEKPLTIPDWKKKGCDICLTYWKTDTWFKLLRDAGFEIINYLEPKPVDLHWAHTDKKKYYSLAKARLVPSGFIFVCRKPKDA